MTLLDVEELTRYWIDHPPLHMLLAAYLGIGRGKRGRSASAAPVGSRAQTGSPVETLLAELGPGFGVGEVHAGLAPVVLDFAELRRRAA